MPLTRNQANSRNTSSQQRQPDPPNNLSHPASSPPRNGRNGNGNGTGINVFLPPHHESNSGIFMGQDAGGGGASQTRLNGGDLQSDGSARNDRTARASNQTDEFFQSESHDADHLAQNEGEEQEEEEEEEGSGISQDHNDGIIRNLSLEMLNQNDSDLLDDRRNRNLNNDNNNHSNNQHHQFNFSSLNETQQDEEMFNHHQHHQLSISRPQSPLSMTRSIQDQYSSQNQLQDSLSQSQEAVQEEFLDLQRRSQTSTGGRNSDLEHQSHSMDHRNQQMTANTPRQEFMRIQSPSPGMGMAKPVRLQQSSPTSPLLPQRSQSRQSLMRELHFNDGADGIHLDSSNASPPNLSLNHSSSSSSIPLSGSLSQPLPNLRSGSSRSMNQNSQSSSESQPSSSQSSSTSSYSHSQPLFQFRTRSQQAIARIDSSSSSGTSISLNPSSQNNNIGRASNHSHSLSLGENGQIESSMASDGRSSTNPNSVLHSTSGLNGTGNGNDVFTFPSRPSVLTRGLSSPMTSTNKSQRMNLGESLNLTMSNNSGMQSQSSRQNQRRSGDELDLSPTDQGSQNRLSAIFKTPLNELGSGRFGRNNNLQTPISNVNASVFSNSIEGSERLSDVNGLNGINNGSHGLFSPFTTPQRSDTDDHHDHGYQFTGNRNGNSNRLGGADRFERRSNRPEQFEDANTNEDYLQEEVEIPSRNHHFHNHHIVPSNGHSQSQSQGEVERDELVDEQNIRNDVLPSSIPDLTDYSTSIENILSNKEEEERLELIELIKYIDEHRSGLKSNPSAGNEKKRYLTELERKRICQHMQVYNDAQQLVVASLFGMDRSNISKISANSEKWLKVSEELIKGTQPVPPHDAILETYKRSQSWCFEMKESGLKVTDSQLRERIPFFAHKVGFNSRNAASWNDWLSKYIDNITFEECLNHGWKDYPAIKIAKKKESSRKGKGKKDKEKPKGKGRSTVDVGIVPSNSSSGLDANHLNRNNHFQSPSISSSYQETQDGTFSPSASSIISNTATSVSAHSRKSSSSSRINRSNLGLSQDDFIQDSSSQNSGTDGLGISFTRNFPNLQNQKNLQRSIHDRNQNQQQNIPDPNENLMSRGSSYQSNTTTNSSSTSNSGSSFAFKNLSHSRISSQPQSRSNSNHNNVMSDKSLSNSGSEGYADDSGLSFPTESNTKTVDSSRERNGELMMNSSSPQTTPKSSHKRHYDLMRQDLPLSSMNEIKRTSDDDVMMEDRDESSANGFSRRLLRPRVLGDPSDRLSASFVDPFASNQRRLESSDKNQDQLSMPSRNDNADHSNNGSLKRRRTDHQRSQGDRLEVDEEEEERNFLSKRSPVRQRVTAVDSDRNRWSSSVFPSVSTFVSTDGIADKRRRVQSSNPSMPLTDRSTGLPLRSPFTQNSTEKFQSNDEDWSSEIDRSRSRERMGGKEALEYESGNRIVTPSTSSISTLRGMTSSDPRGSQHHQQPKVNHHHHLRLHSSSGSSPQRNLRNRNNLLHQQQQQQSQPQSQRSPSPYATSSTSSRLQQTVFDERSRSQSPRNPNLRTRSRSSTNVTNKSTDARKDPGNGLELEQDSNSVSSSTPRFNPSSPFIGTDLGIEEGDMVTIDQAQRSLAVVLRFLSDQPDNYVARSDCFALGSLQATLHAHASAERANNQDEQQR